MTKPITPRLHGVLDYGVVVAFAFAPSLLGPVGFAARSPTCWPWSTSR